MFVMFMYTNSGLLVIEFKLIFNKFFLAVKPEKKKTATPFHCLH